MIPQRLKGQPEQDTLYRGYKRELEDLKTRYWEAGLKIKAVQPRQQRAPRVPGQRKRLPPMLLQIYKSKSCIEKKEDMK